MSSVLTAPWRPTEQSAPPEPAASEKRHSRLPSEAGRSGAALLNQQFWLWGQDIRRPEGNLLLRHGFAQSRPPEGVRASTRYELPLGDGRVIALWGFGLLYGDPTLGGLYLGRFRLAPRLTAAAPADAWAPGELPPLAVPETPEEWARAGALLVPALRWIAAYEGWVGEAVGGEYRRGCLDRWPRASCPAEAIGPRWIRLAHRCARSLRRVPGDGIPGRGTPAPGDTPSPGRDPVELRGPGRRVAPGPGSAETKPR